ncbi:3'-5' exonuclease [Bifidobacterium choloepi]|uniref:3'-5' exonuclease n=1 Tax=Bifidobacterium choloepi TaxID=2614131 RepID=A0A6I5NA08_9BIFI|nr:3'-5' exonuclease [Bifidobacterium choloepi]NEG70631.1 3'-5' exonuclease [Bifidobacterium choloepi]
MAVHSNSTFRLPHDYVALDIETTGFSPRTEAITEIGAVRIRDGKIVGTFTQLVDPGKPIPSRITHLTGIGDAMVAGQPPIDIVMPTFIDWLASDIIVGHNVRFDLSFLTEAALRTVGHPAGFHAPSLDTMTIDKRLFPSERHRLADLIVRYGIADTEEHRALSDATQTYQCLEWQRRYIGANDSVTTSVNTRFRV